VIEKKKEFLEIMLEEHASERAGWRDNGVEAVGSRPAAPSPIWDGNIVGT
jgi:hypothetical protein